MPTRLLERQAKGCLRAPRYVHGLIDFASSDYLGLAHSSQLTEAALQEWKKHKGDLNGFGATGSRLLTGHTAYVEKLEQQLADFHRFEAATLFSCGYMANLGLLSAVAKANDVFFYDAHLHASSHDGMRLSQARIFPFRHNQVEHLEQQLKKKQCSGSLGKRFICIESIYSTDGSIAPLKDFAWLAKQYDAHLIVDEAHAVGVCGPAGRGLTAEFGLMPEVFAQVTTFGKALGVYGAVVLGSGTLKQLLANFARTFIYTTALPLISLAAIKSSYDILPTLESERQNLRERIGQFKKFSANASETSIQPIKIRGNEAVKAASLTLANFGYDVRALMSPTVQRGHERLRICLHAYNSSTEVEGLIEALNCIERGVHA